MKRVTTLCAVILTRKKKGCRKESTSMATTRRNFDAEKSTWTQIGFAEIADDSRLWLFFKEKMRPPKTIQKSRKKKNIVIESKSLF